MINDSATRSYGAVFNSFYDFEGAYEEHYKNAFGTKCWSLGPVSLWANQDISDKSERGDTKVEEGEDSDLFKWLNSKKENSVIYVSFGSLNKFPLSQLIEIAHALEASSHDFIWVVRKNIDDKEGEDEGLVMENGEEAEEMRLRAKGLSDDAKKAILVGGSSHANLMQLIEELKSLKLQRLNGN
jgi:soyasapogenol B glucuronide galactosyltransferase